VPKYAPSVIYKFITEELFDHEMDDIMLPGFVHHFIYEEFHPNHEYDYAGTPKSLTTISFAGRLMNSTFTNLPIGSIRRF